LKRCSVVVGAGTGLGNTALQSRSCESGRSIVSPQKLQVHMKCAIWDRIITGGLCHEPISHLVSLTQ